ncbi:MAG: PKD domain-containing protein [Reichenbachiella sp.]|uniref:PKD domain-containing protein n=2 Tax=Reichenbachiella sp. TaxID=2184521 RepID=UPI0032674B54
MSRNRKKRILLSLFSVGLVCFVWFEGSKETARLDKDDYPIWMEMMEEPNVNLEEAARAFDAYWDNHAHYRGDKSKKFERWYEANRKRLDQNGNVISAAQVRNEYQRMRELTAAAQEGKWFNYGPVNVGRTVDGDPRNGGRVKDVAFHPTDPNTFYVSCFKSGFFKTTDAGSTWSQMTDHLSEEVYISKLKTADPNTIYLGTNLGVLKSINGGADWASTGLSTYKTNALLIKPDNEDIILVGNEVGIYRSINAGESFTQVKSASLVEELRIHPTNNNIIYASTNGSGYGSTADRDSQFFRSVDGGVTWTENSTDFGDGSFMKLAVTPAKPDYVYAINTRDYDGQNSFEGVYKSTDAGVTFTKQSGDTPCITGYDDSGAISRGQPNYNLFIVSDPNNSDIIYAGGVKSWKSVDGGVNWTQAFNNVTALGFGLHLDQLTWAYSPVNDQLYAVNDGGIYFLNEDSKFQTITDGLPIAEVWECTQSQVNKENVAGGTFHAGIKLNRNGVWYSPWGGDEATCLFDYSDDKYVYHFKYEKISRSVDGGFSFQRINPTSADRGFYTGTGVLDKTDVNTLYVGLFEVERTENARASSSLVTWSKISSFGGSSRIQKIEQSDADHNILYVSREGGKFYRSDNVRSDVPTFSDITANLPTAGVANDIAAHPTDVNIVYITLGNEVYKSSNKGISWTNMSSGLPGLPLLEMVYDKSSNEGIYVGTDIGVYYKDADMASWIDYSNGLPAVRVSGMDIYYGATRSESFLTVSTDGRGFWRSELNGEIASAPLITFTADKTSIFENGKVQFINSTDASVGSFLWTFEGGNPATSIDKNPEVTYATLGSFGVTLEYTTNAGTTTKSEPGYITVNTLIPPVANFTAVSQSVFQGNLASFEDASENEPSQWFWSFEGGDPATSDQQNPNVTYNTIGSYKVSLTVTNAKGTDTKEVIDYITVTANAGTGTLQAHYDFQGNLNDESTYQRSLVATGGYTPTFVADKAANALSAYEAPAITGNYLTTGYKGIGGNGPRTVMAWFKTPPAGDRKTIVSWGDNQAGKMFNVMVQGGRIRVEGGSCSTLSTVVGLDDDQWHHLAVTFDPADGGQLNDIKVYVDGVFDANAPDSFNAGQIINTDNSNNPVRIGSVLYNATYYWRGSLDNIRVYSEALSAIQIDELGTSIPPTAQFDAEQTTINAGGSVNFVDESTDSPTTWSWEFEGGNPAASTDRHPTVEYAEEGKYKVTLTVSNSKGSDAVSKVEFITVDPVVLDVKKKNNQKLSIYPNPTSGIIKIESHESIKGVKLMNTLGQKVISEVQLRKSGELDVSGLKKGAYVLIVQFYSGLVHRKIIIE